MIFGRPLTRNEFLAQLAEEWSLCDEPSACPVCAIPLAENAPLPLPAPPPHATVAAVDYRAVLTARPLGEMVADGEMTPFALAMLGACEVCE